MKRRSFLQSAATLPVATLPMAASAAITKKPVLMKVGTQHSTDDDTLNACSAFGVVNICSDEPSRKFDEKWSVEGLTQLREKVEKHGITLEAVPLPMSSSYITKAENPEIMLGKSPERDREIDNICQMIRNCKRAGIPLVKYNMTILG